MASLSKQPNGGWLIQFTVTNGDGLGKKRGTIRTGKCAAKRARSIKGRIEDIVAARAGGYAMEQETADWLRKIDDTLHQRIAKTGLIEPREQQATATLGGFVDGYIERRTDAKPASKVVWGHAARNLKHFFGPDRDIASITPGDCEDFKLYLISLDLASSTTHKRLEVSRQFFRDARKRGYIQHNPFEDVQVRAVQTTDRDYFLDAETFRRIIAECNPVWRLIVTLARYGGLRCPSEVLSLKWDGVNWQTGRMVVHSPKTEHHGKGSRVVPIFPEVLPALQEAWESAPPGAIYVVDADHYRKAAQGPQGWRNSNLRTQLHRILKRAGVPPWPKTFGNMRISRETELAATHPIHVVAAWMGNTPKIATKHYLKVTDSDFEKATGRAAKSAASALQKALRPTSADSRDDPQEPPQPLTGLHTSGDNGESWRGSADPQNGRGGIRTAPVNIEENALHGSSAAKSAALFDATPDDPELREVVEAWGALPAALRAGILAMVRQSGSGEG